MSAAVASESQAEKLTRQFYEWEHRGRGWQVWPKPVALEPAFRPFYGHYLSDRVVVDDGRRPTFLSSLLSSVSQSLAGPPKQPAPEVPEPEEEPEPTFLDDRDQLIELQTLLPANLDIPREAFEQFLLSLSACREPVAFELLGLPGQIGAQFAVSRRDAPLIGQQLQAFFPEAVFQPQQYTLGTAWGEMESAVVEFGLGWVEKQKFVKGIFVTCKVAESHCWHWPGL